MIIPAAAISSGANVIRFPRRCSNLLSQRKMTPHCFSSSSSSIATTTTSTTVSSTTTAPTEVESKPKPWLFVGLGNPGKKYQGTRHNVGFEMIDAVAEAEGISMSTVSFKALFGKGRIGNVPVMLAKPQTFMNLSGESVGSIVSYYKIPLKQVVVVFDDLDLPFAALRLLPKGGHGGHNGWHKFIDEGEVTSLGVTAMRSIIDHFKGSRDFPRLRIGIGRPPGKMDPANFVLRPFNKQERAELDFTLQSGLEALRILLVEGFNKSATLVNTPKSMKQLG